MSSPVQYTTKQQPEASLKTLSASHYANDWRCFPCQAKCVMLENRRRKNSTKFAVQQLSLMFLGGKSQGYKGGQVRIEEIFDPDLKMVTVPNLFSIQFSNRNVSITLNRHEKALENGNLLVPANWIYFSRSAGDAAFAPNGRDVGFPKSLLPAQRSE